MISIIIPVYNVEKYLTKCLDSVVNQTYKNIEIICINDGSPDNSWKILEKYQKIDKRIKVVNQINQGLSAARNTGINEAQGEFIFFLDSDDWLPLNAMELLKEKQKDKNSDIVIGGRNIVTCHGINLFLPKDYKKTLDFKTYIEMSFKDENFRPAAWGKLYKTEIIKNNKIYFPNGLLYEDLLFVIKYLYFSNKISILDKSVYNYKYDRGDSIINSIDIRDMDCLKIIEELETFFKEKKIEELLKEEYFVNFIMRWIIYATIGKFCKKNIKYDDFKTYINLLKKNKVFNKYSSSYLKSNSIFIKTIKGKMIFYRNKIYLLGVKSNAMRWVYFYTQLNRILIR